MGTASLTWAHRRQQALHPQVQELLDLRQELLVLRPVPQDLPPALLVPLRELLDRQPVRLVPLL